MADITSQYPSLTLQGTKSSSSKPKGRSLHTTRAFSPGSLIALFKSPLICIPAGPAARTTCSWCLTPGKPTSLCTGCRAIAYCGPPCQKNHWPRVHKAECKAFKRIRKSAGQEWLPTVVRGLVQVLLKWESGSDEDREDVRRAFVGGGDAAVVLEGNTDGFRSKPIWKDFEVQALAGVKYAGLEASEENVKLALEILCKIQTNAFDRSEPDVGRNGSYLDPTLAMVNHSCVPNAVVAFVKRKAYLRAVAPIAAGEEITISYVDYTKPKLFRQYGLELYHFECKCRRCEEDLDVYQVCRDSPVASLNSTSFAPDVEKLRNPDIEAKLTLEPSFRTQIDKIYALCRPETAVAPDERLTKLRFAWKLCEPLVKARMWAAEPLGHVFQQAITYYMERQNFLHALVMECFAITRQDPYKYVSPFEPWRLKGLLMVAKTIPNTAMPSEQGFKTVNPDIVEVLRETDEGSLYQAILLMVIKYAPMAHSDEWEVLADAKRMIKDIEALGAERQQESAILKEWIKNPDNPGARKFFLERAVKPVQSLADLAIPILRAELEPE